MTIIILSLIWLYCLKGKQFYSELYRNRVALIPNNDNERYLNKLKDKSLYWYQFNVFVDDAPFKNATDGLLEDRPSAISSWIEYLIGFKMLGLISFLFLLLFSSSLHFITYVFCFYYFSWFLNQGVKF